MEQLWIFQHSTYIIVLQAMTVLAVMVYIALQHFKAGYGFLRTPQWGPTVPNRIGWVLMEAPVFVAMLLFYLAAADRTQLVTSLFTAFFLLHYFQRSFIFPMLIKGKGRMPVSIILMGVTFNLINVYMLGSWLFLHAPEGRYGTEWLATPQFVAGTVIFFAGMFINIQSDRIIRNLRRPGDNRHYIPKGGMFRYVSSANYFGEITEWFGFAVLTWSLPGAIFCIWTFANLAPRANSLYEKYTEEFGEEFTSLKRKRVLPFIY